MSENITTQADASVKCLSLEERGAYYDIIALIAINSGRIPDDPQWIARRMCIPESDWLRLRTALIEKKQIEVHKGSIYGGRV